MTKKEFIKSFADNIDYMNTCDHNTLTEDSPLELFQEWDSVTMADAAVWIMYTCKVKITRQQMKQAKTLGDIYNLTVK